MQNRKKKYIPLCAQKKISIHKCAELIGITPQSVCRLKKRYLQCGDSVFIHGNSGKRSRKKIYDYNQIANDYEKFKGTPFMSFRDDMADYLAYKNVPSYTTLYKILTKNGIVSPRAKIPVREKKKHLPRKERPNEGDMIQIDGSEHDWFMTGEKCTLHGAIDDATHKLTALYFCQNECLLGYYAMLSMTAERMGGLPRAIYSDRSSCFFITKESREKCSITEQLEGIKNAETQWQKTCKELGIVLIAAHSPEAKGRIERIWETLQGRLPYIFRYLGITTIEQANTFLPDYIDKINERFSVPPQETEKHWKELPKGKDYDFIFSIHAEKHTKKEGRFNYHGYNFKIPSINQSGVKFTLCLSESFGIRAYIDGKYLDVTLDDEISDVVGDRMPIVEKDLIYRYFYADTHSGASIIS